MDLIEALGIRVTAICDLLATDVDLTSRAKAPHGRIRKRGDVGGGNAVGRPGVLRIRRRRQSYTNAATVGVNRDATNFPFSSNQRLTFSSP